ncbi:hypothetical protein SAMN05444392_101460 [Seinonella peptonophila]|uniref:Uncharacterized protein n=1 Tax=Seinonella peptonophila TaxID=112248 RepID=A0A1M4TGX4_9BACL|nr:hypothetical protein [Seinonella peptonophila]SHE43668.1 hypothetical protein SAMN05444392_101460 [Seinonella peptonophila]
MKPRQMRRKRMNPAAPLLTPPYKPEKKGITSLLPKVSAAQVVKAINHLLTVRNTVRTVSSSIQRIENFVDSTCQLFEIANNFIDIPKDQTSAPAQKKNPGSKLPFKDEEIPKIDLPNNPPASGLGQMLGRIDPKALLGMLNRLLGNTQQAEAQVSTSISSPSDYNPNEYYDEY